MRPRSPLRRAIGAFAFTSAFCACAALAGSASVYAASPTQAVANDHVGAAVCGECHAAEHAAWSHSIIVTRCRSPMRRSVLGDFRNAKFSYAGTTSMFSTRDGKYFVRTDGPDGKLADFEIKYTFGVEPLQQYLIELPGGRLQALGIAWDARPKAQGGQRWFHLYPGQNLRAGDPLHWTGVNQNWNFMCAECHSTQLRKNFDAATGRFATTWAEIDVACEACHGPGAEHVARARAKRDGKAYSSADSGLVARARPNAKASRGRRWPRPATRNAARRERRRAKSTCARAATPAPRASPTTTSTASRCRTRIVSPRSTRASTGATGRSATRSTSGARSCRAGCTQRASPAPTATIRTRWSCAVPATTSARNAISRRNTTRPRTPTTRRERRAADALPATCRRRPTCASTRGMIIRCGFRAPICRRSSARRTPAMRVTRRRRRSGRRTPFAAGLARAPVGYQTFGEALQAGRQERPARAAR